MHESPRIAATQAGCDWKKTVSKMALIRLEMGLKWACN